MNSQTELRKAIEKEEENIMNKRLQDLAKKPEWTRTPYGKQGKEPRDAMV